jgi:hypothetical protein
MTETRLCASARVCAFVVVLLAATVLAAASVAATRTTAPSTKVTVLVVIDDKGIRVHSFVGLGNQVPGKNEENEPSSMQALLGPVPRGDFMSFNIFNRGKKMHDFTIFGKKTPPIKPGKKAHLFAQALTRGNFPYRSTLDKSKAFRGYFVIF